jgi:uncharacterized membrane protein (Fun14 family)
VYKIEQALDGIVALKHGVLIGICSRSSSFLIGFTSGFLDG